MGTEMDETIRRCLRIAGADPEGDVPPTEQQLEDGAMLLNLAFTRAGHTPPAPIWFAWRDGAAIVGFEGLDDKPC